MVGHIKAPSFKWILPNIFVHKRINKLSILKSCIYGSQEASIVWFLGGCHICMTVSTNEGRIWVWVYFRKFGLCSCKIPCRKSKLDGLSPMTCDWLLDFSERYYSHIFKLTNVKSSRNKIRYYNALVHNGMKEKPLVSYNPDLYNIMQHTHTVGR